MKKVQAHPSTSDSHGQVKRFREGREFVLEAEQWLPATPETIWRFVGDCRHMNLVIPAFMKFEILSAATDGTLPEILPGVQYEYRLKLHGISVFCACLSKKCSIPFDSVTFKIKAPTPVLATSTGLTRNRAGRGPATSSATVRRADHWHR